MFKKILLCLPPMEVSESVTEMALALAKKQNARVCLFHAPGVMSSGWGSVGHLLPSGEVEKIKANIESAFKGDLDRLPGYSIIVEPGLPHSEILRNARRENVDLIVMGPHAQADADRRQKVWGMAGSTLEKVSQKARCPVMIVSRAEPEKQVEFRNIVMATDFTHQAAFALNFACNMAREFDSALHVFNVFDIGGEGDMAELSQQDIEHYLKRTREDMEKKFQPQFHGLRSTSIDVWEGKPFVEILKYARFKDADLVVMAHHSTGVDPEKAFLGSTVAHVSLRSSCPVISVNRYIYPTPVDREAAGA